MALEKLEVGMPREDVQAKWGEPHRRAVRTTPEGSIIETWHWSWPNAMTSATFGPESTVVSFTMNEALATDEETEKEKA